MSRPPADSAPDSIGPPDRQTLRLLERHLTPDSLVAETAFDPDSYELRLLTAVLDMARYPESVSTARLDIRWFISEDFIFHYVKITTIAASGNTVGIGTQTRTIPGYASTSHRLPTTSLILNSRRSIRLKCTRRYLLRSSSVLGLFDLSEGVRLAVFSHIVFARTSAGFFHWTEHSNASLEMTRV